MDDAKRRLVTDLELCYDRWSREWAMWVRNDTQPTRDDVRSLLLELKEIIMDHSEKDMRKLIEYNYID